MPIEAADSHAGRASPEADSPTADSPTADSPTAESPKAALRSAILRRRRERLRRDPGGVVADGVALAAHLLAAPEFAGLRPGETVAAYLELPTEVPALPVRRALEARGITVLVPVLRPDRDLDWITWESDRTARPAPGAGAGAGAGADAGDAAVILLPGVAGDLDGNRLGRGGGSYDRVLGRRPPQGVRRPWTCLLLFADELLDGVPVEPHDAAVDAIATPLGLYRIRHI